MIGQSTTETLPARVSLYPSWVGQSIFKPSPIDPADCNAVPKGHMPVVSLKLDAATDTAHVRMRGDVRSTDVLTTINTFYHEPWFDSGMKVLFDMRQARVAMSPQEVREVVTFASADRDKRPGGRVAVVTDRDADYGMVRIAQVYLEEVQIELMVFRAMEEACHWLDGEGTYAPQWPATRLEPDEGEKAG